MAQDPALEHLEGTVATEKVAAALRELRELSPEELDNRKQKDLLSYLQEQDIVPSPQFQEEFRRWPEPVQSYVRDELFDYARNPRDESEAREDARVIAEFLTYALTGGWPDGFPPEVIDRALAAVARELRSYYGRDEDDDELPCWRRG